jgi:hypothetical protein
MQLFSSSSAWSISSLCTPPVGARRTGRWHRPHRWRARRGNASPDCRVAGVTGCLLESKHYTLLMPSNLALACTRGRYGLAQAIPVEASIRFLSIAAEQ